MCYVSSKKTHSCILNKKHKDPLSGRNTKISNAQIGIHINIFGNIDIGGSNMWECNK